MTPAKLAVNCGRFIAARFIKPMDAQLNIKLIAVFLSMVEHVRNERRLLTEQEVAYIFDVDVQTVARWRKSGLIEHVNFEGSIVRYRWEHVERRIAACEQQGLQPKQPVGRARRIARKVA